MWLNAMPELAKCVPRRTACWKPWLVSFESLLPALQELISMGAASDTEAHVLYLSDVVHSFTVANQIQFHFLRHERSAQTRARSAVRGGIGGDVTGKQSWEDAHFKSAERVGLCSSVASKVADRSRARSTPADAASKP